MLMGIIEGVAIGLAVAGIIAIIRWIFKSVQARRVARDNVLAAQEAERQRLAQRRKTRILSPVGIRIPGAGPWAGTSASGYGIAVRDDLRRRGLTPADYARGDSHRKSK
jgi:hypothetical protein